MSHTHQNEYEERIKGTLLGTAVGDSLGLPAEGLSRRRVQKRFRGRWKQQLAFGRGMISDDTEHTVFVAQSILEHGQSTDAFRKALAWKLRWWLLALPAGVGLATLRSIVRLWLGVSSKKSGVYSAGNGAAMRSAIIGAVFSDAPQSIDEYVTASTRLTHTDPRALSGALAIARLANWTANRQVADPFDPFAINEVFAVLQTSAEPGDNEWQNILRKIRSACDNQSSVEEFAAEMGLSKGVTGYVYHTVPVAVYAWMRHYGDFEQTVTTVLRCGGDTDTVGAIAGALAGATVGERGIPQDWLDGVWDFPFGIEYLRRLGKRLAGDRAEAVDKHRFSFFPLVRIPRNMLFLLLILAHVFRRLAPPY